MEKKSSSESEMAFNEMILKKQSEKTDFRATQVAEGNKTSQYFKNRADVELSSSV